MPRHTPSPPTSRRMALDKPVRIIPAPCSRCNGEGGSPDWVGFTCLRCQGEGIDPVLKVYAFPLDYTDEDILQFEATRLLRNARESQRRRAKRGLGDILTRRDNIREYPILVSLLHRYPYGDQLIDDILAKVDGYPLTDSQVSTLVSAIEAHDFRLAQLASLPDLPEGTYELIGTAVSVRTMNGRFGPQDKLLLQLDSGQRVYGTLPSSLTGAEPGQRVALTATVKRSDSDPLFGYFKRPRKGRVL